MADVRQINVLGFGIAVEAVPARSEAMSGWRISVVPSWRFSLDLGGGGVLQDGGWRGW